MDQLSRSCLPELSLPQLPDGSAAWHTTVTSALDWYAWAGEQVSSLVEPSLEQTGAPNQTTTKKPELVRPATVSAPHPSHSAHHTRR
jgi:hypothetical protein